MLCRAVSSPVLPCPALSCRAVPCPLFPFPALSCPALPCRTILSRPVLCALTCLALPCFALPCPVLSCPILRFVTHHFFLPSTSPWHYDTHSSALCRSLRPVLALRPTLSPVTPFPCPAVIPATPIVLCCICTMSLLGLMCPPLCPWHDPNLTFVCAVLVLPWTQFWFCPCCHPCPMSCTLYFYLFPFFIMDIRYYIYLLICIFYILI